MELTSEFSEWLQCAICLEDMTLRSPRSLRCLHTFCHECLVDLYAGSFGCDLPCPTCRVKTRITGEGIKGLPVNFMLTSIGKKRENCKVQTPRRCEGCDFEGIHTVPLIHCILCDSDFCDACLVQYMQEKKSIRSILGLEKHVLKKINYDIEGDAVLCSDKKPFSHFCVTCHKALCRLCKDTHKDHDVHMLDDGLPRELEYLKEEYNLLQGMNSQAEEICGKKVRECSDLEQEIINAGQCAKEAIDEKVQNMLDEISQACKGPLEERKMQLAQCHQYITSKSMQLSNHSIQGHNSIPFLKNYGKNLLRHQDETKSIPYVYTFRPNKANLGWLMRISVESIKSFHKILLSICILLVLILGLLGEHMLGMTSDPICFIFVFPAFILRQFVYPRDENNPQSVRVRRSAWVFINFLYDHYLKRVQVR